MPREYGERIHYILGRSPQGSSILLHDNFEGLESDPPKFGPVPGVGSCLYRRSTSEVYNGDYSLQLRITQKIPDGFHWGDVGRSFGWRGHKRFECSALFKPAKLNAAMGYEFQVRIIHAGSLYRAGLRYDAQAKAFYYTAYTGGWVWLSDVTESLDRACWHRFYFVVDLEKEEYGPSGVDAVDFGLSGEKISRRNSILPDVAYVLVGVAGSTFLYFYVYVDEVMVREI